MGRLLILNDHSDEVPLHGSLESLFVLVRVDDCGDLTSVNDSLKLAFKNLIERVLLEEVNDTESHLLSLGVNNSQQRVINDIRLREAESVIIDANVKDPVDGVPDGQRSTHEGKLEVVVMQYNTR